MRIDVQNAILLLLCLVLLLTTFTLSASAAESVPVTLTSEPTGLVQYYSGNSLVTLNFSKFSGDSDVFVVTYENMRDDYVADSSETFGFLFFSTSSFVVRWRLGSNGNYGNLSSTYDEDNNIYYLTDGMKVKSGTSPALQYAMPYFSTEENAISYATSYLNGTPTPEPTSFQYTLPPGNVAYIPIPSGQSSPITYTLTTTYYMAFGNNDTSHINQVVTVMSSLPSTSNNVAPSSPKIPWTNNGNLNLFGISANKIYQGSIPTNYGGQYLVVVNPMTMPSQAGLIGGEIYTNGSINISVSAVSGSPHIYPMSESLVLNPGDDIGSESTYGDSGYTYEVDPETGEIIWTDPDGGSSAPVAGGNNPMPTPNTIFDWLRNISQQFSDFLRGPVQAVQVVVSAIRDFMGSFTQLYQWLPSPVYSLITSALMIALTIGVIKIFV